MNIYSNISMSDSPWILPSTGITLTFMALVYELSVCYSIDTRCPRTQR